MTRIIVPPPNKKIFNSQKTRIRAEDLEFKEKKIKFCASSFEVLSLGNL